ncbi:MAG: inorganic phosphate transporter [Nevskiaceae bacterium]|nr:MAG: inorganic phosphate transporter [Nevskiaceae bacterium]TBR73242.1 MAG: inorganic phosphate transporter [Nevskiaceae bacterium]
MSLTLLVVVILIALTFTYINGFHDTANSIATVIATKVLTPRQAVLMAAVTNMIGALSGTAVAKTIAEGLINAQMVNEGAFFLLSALGGAIIWNLITWWWGLPSSSSHGLVGGMVGAALAVATNNLDAVIWWTPGNGHWWDATGVIPKVVLPMVASPLLGFAVAFAAMLALYLLLLWFSRQNRFPILHRLGRTSNVNAFFGRSQIFSAAAMGLSHGMNDAQKTMGIVALALAGATASGTLDDVPHWLAFLRIQETAGGDFNVPAWVAVVCALTMAAGTAGGGWRIIKTLGHKMVRLHPIHGFVAETSSALVIVTASLFGIPVSTTHCVSSAIMGVGAAKRPGAIRWSIVERMVWAWVLTLPITAALAYLISRLLALLA